MGLIIFGIGQYKRRVIHSIILAGMRRFAGRRDVCCALGHSDGGLTARQTDKTSIKIIQPGTQYWGAIPGRICGDKNHLELVSRLGGQLLQAARYIGHLEWAFIGAMSIAKKEQRDVPLRLRPEIERHTRCIGESKFWF